MIQVLGKQIYWKQAQREIFFILYLLKRRVMAGKGQVKSYFKIVRRPMKHKNKRRKSSHSDVVPGLNHYVQVRFDSSRVLHLVLFGFPCSSMERKYL